MPRATVVAAVTLVIALALPAGAMGQWHSARFGVGPKASRWHSRQRYRATDAVAVRLFVRGDELYAEPSSACASNFYGHGVAVHLAICGKRSPIRVRAAAVNGRRRLLIRWRIVR